MASAMVLHFARNSGLLLRFLNDRIVLFLGKLAAKGRLESCRSGMLAKLREEC